MLINTQKQPPKATSTSLFASELDVVKRLYAESFTGLPGYGNKKDVGKKLVDIFGKGWLEPITDEDELISTLIDNILRGGVPEGHSNRSKPIADVKKYAKKYQPLLNELD